MGNLIFYFSKQAIEQMCFNYLGQNTEREITIGEQNNTKVSIGISKLFQNLIGVSPEASVSGENNKSEATKYINDFTSRILQLINQTETLPLPDILDFKLDSENVVYKFHLDFKIQEIYQQKKVGNLVKLLHDSPSLKIEGYTSKSNWTSLSMLNGILHTNHNSTTNLDKIKGLLTPLKSTCENNKTFITAQFLVLYR